MSKLATLKIQPGKNEPIWANPEILHFFMIIFLTKNIHSYGQRVPEWKIAHIWQSKEPKNTKKTPYNVSVICFQSLTDVLQQPVVYCTHGRHSRSCAGPRLLLSPGCCWAGGRRSAGAGACLSCAHTWHHKIMPWDSTWKVARCGHSLWTPLPQVTTSPRPSASRD